MGIRVQFGLGVGSTYSGTAGAWASAALISATGAVSVIGTLNATWLVTGVQLEVGSAATPFERRQFTHEVGLCQRYFCKNSSLGSVAVNGASFATEAFSSGGAFAYNTVAAYVSFLKFPVTMRVAPATVTFINTNLPSPSTAGQWSIFNGSTWLNAAVAIQSVTTEGFGPTLAGGWSVTGAFPLYYAWTASAEL
jgi:hypothetical protein